MRLEDIRISGIPGASKPTFIVKGV